MANLHTLGSEHATRTDVWREGEASLTCVARTDVIHSSEEQTVGQSNSKHGPCHIMLLLSDQ